MTRTRARKILQSIGCAGPAVAMLALAALGEGVVPGVELSRDAAEARLQPACKYTYQRLQPCASEAGGCNSVHQRLQPPVAEAA